MLRNYTLTTAWESKLQRNATTAMSLMGMAVHRRAPTDVAIGDERD